MYTSRVDVYINLGGCVQQPHSRTRYPCNMNDDDDGDTGVSRVIFYLPGKRKKRQKPKPGILLPKPGILFRQLATPLHPRSPPPGWAPGGERARKLPTKNTLGSPARYLGYPHFFSGDEIWYPCNMFPGKMSHVGPMWACAGLSFAAGTRGRRPNPGT